VSPATDHSLGERNGNAVGTKCRRAAKDGTLKEEGPTGVLPKVLASRTTTTTNVSNPQTPWSTWTTHSPERNKNKPTKQKEKD